MVIFLKLVGLAHQLGVCDGLTSFRCLKRSCTIVCWGGGVGWAWVWLQFSQLGFTQLL